jgi:hypothetical protein
MVNPAFDNHGSFILADRLKMVVQQMALPQLKYCHNDN